MNCCATPWRWASPTSWSLSCPVPARSSARSLPPSARWSCAMPRKSPPLTSSTWMTRGRRRRWPRWSRPACRSWPTLAQRSICRSGASPSSSMTMCSARALRTCSIAERASGSLSQQAWARLSEPRLQTRSTRPLLSLLWCASWARCWASRAVGRPVPLARPPAWLAARAS